MFHVVSAAQSVLYFGLSTEARPPVSVEHAIFLELNTGRCFVVENGVWKQLLPSGQTQTVH
jgi:hypothetical protein